MNLEFYRFMCYTLFVITKISLLILVFMFFLESFLSAQNPESFTDECIPEISLASEERPKNYFLDFINKKAYAAIKEEKGILREKWKEFLGMDIFYPYYKTKEVEEWMVKKTSIEFFNIKGKPKFESNQIKYIFKVKF